MNKNERWKKAQDYEKNFWESVKDWEDFEFYEAFSQELTEDLQPFIELQENSSILEIGSGAAGILTYLPGKRYAIDPLEDYYSSVSEFTDIRDSQVKYHAGKGENLPFPDNMFDLVIMDNVLDHCEDPEMVFAQINRVMKKGSVLYFQQNTYNCWGKMVRWIMERFLIDHGHPYTFTKQDLIRIIRKEKFKLLAYQSSGYPRSWWSDLKAGTRKELLKALLFVTRDKTRYILRLRK